MRVLIYNLYRANAFVTNTVSYAEAMEWRAQNSKNKFEIVLKDYVKPETDKEKEKRLRTIKARMIAIHSS
jgi:hypothetical protein